MTLIDKLMECRWTWQGPTMRQQDGEASFEMRIQELPDFFVAARTRDGVQMEMEDALRAFLLSYLDRGESPPVPRSHPQPL